MREQRCPSCNEPIEPGATFCTACGATVAQRAAPSARPVVSVASPSRPRHSKVALLVVKRGTEEGKTVQVNGQVSLGSDRVNDFALADRSVSARHGLIRLEDGVHVYHDLASLNGSYLVKGRFRERIGAPLKLMHGDVIEVGRTRLVYLEESR